MPRRVGRPVTEARLKHIEETPYEELDRGDRRLKTLIEKHGSYQASLRALASNRILAGYNGGIHRGGQGFHTWEKDTLRRFVSNRKRDSSGRFVPYPSQEAHKEDRQQSRHDLPETEA